MTTINNKYKNSDSINFSMMIKLKEGMEFAITSHVSYIQIIANKSIWNFSFLVSHTVYFTGMMVFTLTSQIYHRISVLVPVLVRVPEYLSTSTSTSTSTMTFELTSTRNSVLEYCEYEYPSPLAGSHYDEIPSDLSPCYWQFEQTNEMFNSLFPCDVMMKLCWFWCVSK